MKLSTGVAAGSRVLTPRDRRGKGGRKVEPFLEPESGFSVEPQQPSAIKTLRNSMVGVTGFEPATPTSRKQLRDSNIDTERETCDLHAHPDRISGRWVSARLLWNSRNARKLATCRFLSCYAEVGWCPLSGHRCSASFGEFSLRHATERDGHSVALPCGCSYARAPRLRWRAGRLALPTLTHRYVARRESRLEA